eukprot:2263837-Pleurochrysis_carterae.AAC.1
MACDMLFEPTRRPLVVCPKHEAKIKYQNSTFSGVKIGDVPRYACAFDQSLIRRFWAVAVGIKSRVQLHLAGEHLDVAWGRAGDARAICALVSQVPNRNRHHSRVLSAPARAAAHRTARRCLRWVALTACTASQQAAPARQTFRARPQPRQLTTRKYCKGAGVERKVQNMFVIHVLGTNMLIHEALEDVDHAYATSTTRYIRQATVRPLSLCPLGKARHVKYSSVFPSLLTLGSVVSVCRMYC